MKLGALRLVPAPLAAPMPAQRARVGSGELLSACRVAREAGAELAALWVTDDSDRGEGFCVRVLLRADDGLLLLEHRLPDASSRYPDLASVFPSAARMQRAAFDLTGIAAQADDDRPWLWMAAWPIDRFPLRRDFAASPSWQPGDEDYRFVRVEGEGVHEIAVGPVHAGTIEPGHFRFQVVGEKVLRLEERLGFTHKGIEKRFTTLPIAEAPRLAGRICGDSTVAYAFAFAQALEGLAGVAPPPRALWLRALALERERIANHLGDLGALGNDAGLAFGLAQFSRLREDVLRGNRAAFGHRLAMDFVVPGGVARDPADAQLSAMRDEGARIADDARALRTIYDEHAGVQDRFRTCGRVAPDLARMLGMTGLAARASGGTRDLRADFPGVPYAALGMRTMHREQGDVAARVAVRFDELFESLRLVGAIVDALPPGAIAATMPPRLPAGLALGSVEGWRGPVTFAVEAGTDGAIRRCHPHDPSWQNWPAVEHAALGNIVPDFPLINKSFNLAYSGHDL
jgi:Ni,Fe-hydrogenase III large subunit/NADH:ubiquinone oxidoreductase subunit C